MERKKLKQLHLRLSSAIFQLFERSFWRGLIIVLLAFGLSGCYITINSISVPSAALLGQTINIVIRGSGNGGDYVNPNGIILQLPIGTEVIETDGLTPDSSITSGYTAEAGYQLWGGTQNVVGTSETRTIALKINNTVTPGTYYIKAAVGGFVEGVWTNLAPGSTNFAEISGAYQSNEMLISAIGIGITSPAGGEYWYQGFNRTISWIYSGNVGTDVSIELYEGSSPVYTVSTNVSIGSGGSGVYEWLIPSEGIGGYNDYQIKITSISNSSYNVLSPFFSILQPYIYVYDPNGGPLYNGILHQIQWQYAGLDGTTINIDLYKGGVFYASVAGGVDVGTGGNNGYGGYGFYDWTPFLPVGNDYQIKVTSTANSNINSFSPVFPIDNCSNYAVMMVSQPSMIPYYYDSLQAAYSDNIATTDSIRDMYAKATDFADGLLFDEEKTVALHGGYDCSLNYVVGYTTVHGSMTISKGSAIVDNLILTAPPPDVVGTWTLVKGDTFTWNINRNGTFTDNLGTGGTWILDVNQIILYYNDAFGTIYSGTVNDIGTYMSGTVTSDAGGLGSWYAFR